MILYLIRHAEAEEIGTGGIVYDFDRPLTARGRDQARALAQSFVKHRLIVDAVATSPLVRAFQTSVEFLSILAPASRAVTSDLLAIDKLKSNHLSDFLARLTPIGERIPSREEKSVAAIGHMPDLGTYAEWLIGAAAKSIHLSKAAVACIHCEEEPARAAGQLMWLVTPDWY